MSNKSGVNTQDHDIGKLIAEQKKKKADEEKATELARQKALIAEFYPFLQGYARNITDAKILLNRSIEAIQFCFQEKMKEEQNRLSGVSLGSLDLDERLDRDKKYELERRLLERFKDEKVGTAISLLGAVHVAIAQVEANENSQRQLKDLDVQF
jgi:hypothetical protein